LCIIGPDNSIRAGNAGAGPELPHNLVSLRVDFDDSIVELIGDQDIACLVELLSLGLGQKAVDEKETSE
jgi:hypothetical protein